MKPVFTMFFLLVLAPAALALSLGDRSWFAALKQSDLIVLGVANEMTIIEDPKAPRDGAHVFSHGRLKVQVNRVVWPAEAKVASFIEVDYGYNVGDYSANGYMDRELVYIVKQKKKDSTGLITRAQALRWWTFAYRPEDLDRVLELRSQLQSGADPKTLTNNIPKAVFSAGR